MSLERWREFLEANDPDREYEEPDPPGKPEACASREHRVALLEIRAARRVGKQHLCGLWRDDDQFSVEALAQMGVRMSGGTGRAHGEVRKA